MTARPWISGRDYTWAPFVSSEGLTSAEIRRQTAGLQVMHLNEAYPRFSLTLAADAAGGASPDDPARSNHSRPSGRPAFSVQEADGKPFRFDRKALEPTMLIFYRGGWCPYCNAHLKDLRTAVPQSPRSGRRVVPSTDRPEILRSSLKEPVDYHLLSDNEVNAARAFGVAFRMDDALRQIQDLRPRSRGNPGRDITSCRSCGVHRRRKARSVCAHESDYTKRLPAADVVKAAQTALVVSYRSTSATTSS